MKTPDTKNPAEGRSDSNAGLGCDMVIIELADFSVRWECSACGVQHKATQKMERSKKCPKCDATINQWITIDDYNDEA